MGDRLANVHRSIYLLFSDGYLPYQGTQLINDDSCFEALRLVRLLLQYPTLCTADTYALYAIFLFQLSRIEARTDSEGQLVELEHQDRSLWQQDMIRLGIHHLNQALNYQQPLSRYQLEALIASLHSNAPSFVATDWNKILSFYEQLLALAPNPFITLNKAIALYFSQKAAVAVNFLEASPHLPFLQEQHHYHAFMGRIFQENGNLLQAREHYSRGLLLAHNQLEKDFFQRKLRQTEAQNL